jgi:hypothetical protein
LDRGIASQGLALSNFQLPFPTAKTAACLAGEPVLPITRLAISRACVGNISIQYWLHIAGFFSAGHVEIAARQAVW